MTKFMTAALLSTALLTSAAFAQTPSAPAASDDKPAATTTMPSDKTTMPSEKPATMPSDKSDTTTTNAKAAVPDDTSRNGTWRSSKIVGLSVYNDSNESIGSISDLLTDDKGTIKAVVIGVGGFLGIGEHSVAVDFDKVKFVKEPMAYAGAGGAKSGGSSTTTGTGSGGASSSGSAQTAPAAKPNPWYPDHAVYSATKDQLKALPAIKYTAN